MTHPEPTMLPLVPSQLLMFYSQKFSHNKATINICTMLHIDTEVELSLLMQATYLALLRNKSASIRIRDIEKKAMQYFSSQAPEQIKVLDYTGRSEAELDADLNRWSRMPFPNNSRDTQLYSVFVIKKPSGFYGIYFRVSHLAFDAYALISMAGDILSVYEALQNGQPIKPLKADPISCYKEDWSYYKSPRYKRDQDFWANEAFTTEPFFTTPNGITEAERKGKRYGPLGTSLGPYKTSARHENYQIPAELVTRVAELASKLSVSAHCIYLLAVRSYLSSVNSYADDVTICDALAKRATLKQKASGGTRVLPVVFRMNFSNSLTFTEACEEMHLLQAKYFSHSDITIGEVFMTLAKKFNIPQRWGYHTVSITYQPYMVTNHTSLPFHLTTYSTGANQMPIYLTIMALDNSGNLNANYDIMDEYVKDGVPKKMHEHILKVLDAATKNPQITLQELNHI